MKKYLKEEGKDFIFGIGFLAAGYFMSLLTSEAPGSGQGWKPSMLELFYGFPAVVFTVLGTTFLVGAILYFNQDKKDDHEE